MAVCLIVAGGCGQATRKLTESEVRFVNEFHTRLKANREAVHGSIEHLSRISSQTIADQHSLKSSISKAKLLESMKSPWVNPHPDFVATQKEVAFYHLYALSEAEQELLQARLKEHQESIGEVKKAYDNLLAIMNRIVECEKVILAHLNRPATAQIITIVDQILAETKAFREALSGSDNPRLKRLAADVAKAEEKVTKVKDYIAKTLDIILKQKESRDEPQ
jgi:hypothetical protein